MGTKVSKSSTEDNIPIKFIDIYNNIISLSKSLYYQYSFLFLDKSFCDKIAIIYDNPLYSLPISTLNKINDKLNTSSHPSLKLILQHKPLQYDKYIIKELELKLTDYFNNKNVEFNNSFFKKYSNISTPQYINIDLSTFFKEPHKGGEGSNNIEKQILAELSKINESFGLNNMSQNNKELRNINNIKENIKIVNNIPIIPKISNITINTPSNIDIYRQFIKDIKEDINNIQPSILNAKKSVTIKNNNSHHNITNILNDNQLKTYNNIIKQPNEELNEELNEKLNNQIDEKLNKTLNNQINKQLNKQLNKRLDETLDEQIHKQLNNTLKNQKINMEKNNNTVNNKQNKTINIHKQKLCDSIINHFIIRGNIIAAILSTLPFKDGDTFKGGYCYQRFLNLSECSVCLPSNYDNLMKMSEDERIYSLLLFINNMDANTCTNAKGYFKILSLNEKRALFNNNNKFNKYYIQSTSLLKQKYYSNLNALIKILNSLLQLPVNNDDLNKLSLLTKDIIDDLYQSCQFYYLYAILALLNADLSYDTVENKQRESLSHMFATSLSG